MTAKHLLGQCAMVVTVALLFLAHLAQPSAAQGSKWWQSEQYKRELGLTAEQTKRLEDIFQAAVPKLKADKKALDLAEAEFEKLLERGDDGSVMDQVERVEAARALMNKDHTLMMLGMKKVLTADQWAKFTALHQERTRSNGRGGSGAK